MNLLLEWDSHSVYNTPSQCEDSTVFILLFIYLFIYVNNEIQEPGQPAPVRPTQPFFPHSGFGEGQWFTDNSQIENVSSQSQVEGGLWLLSGWNGLVDFL